ncbi:calcium-binding protein [Nocardioides terrisoli]|uniref:calcium-binding protein n=1 Tax=Nocardioides terrisoli TaxID=3388267 RepID=UPI00287B7788|nr:hypothetical protein [Nocardioides marmorisolisilvae]
MTSGAGVIAYGGSGNDHLYGSGGDDRLVGGPGDDVFSGVGQGQAPLPVGDGGADVLEGGSGNDDFNHLETVRNDIGVQIRGTNPSSQISGGAGGDTLFGVGTLSGGSGADFIVVSFGVAGSVVAGNSGRDTLAITDPTTDQAQGGGVRFDARAKVETDPIGGRTTWTGVEKYAGTAYSDTFIGSDASEAYYSGTGEGGADRVDMGGGNDTVDLSTGTVRTGQGDDRVFVSNGGNVRTGPGDDRVKAFWDSDCGCGEPFQVRLGAGDDGFHGYNGVSEGGDREFTPADYELVRGGHGHDSVNLRGIASAARVSLASGHGTWKRGFINMRSVETFKGTPHGDHIVGSPQRDDIYGQGGNDVIRGRAGNDVIHGNRGGDHLYGGPGSDTSYGGPGHDVCRAEHRHSC